MVYLYSSHHMYKCQPGPGDLTMHTLNIPDSLALIYHALVETFIKSTFLTQKNNTTFGIPFKKLQFKQINSLIQCSILSCVFCNCVFLCLNIFYCREARILKLLWCVLSLKAG